MITFTNSSNKELNKELNNNLKLYYFNENYLISHIDNINSNICLEYQRNLSPYFCFRYLYNRYDENLEHKVYYNNIIEYFKMSSEYSIDNMVKIYDIALYDKLKYNKQKIQIEIKNNILLKPVFICNGKCSECVEQICDY